MLTIDKLKYYEPGIFARGVTTDNSDGINLADTGKELRWVAVRGDIHDWAIYCHFADKTYEWIKDHGDKVHRGVHIKKLIECDDEAFQMYRH